MKRKTKLFLKLGSSIFTALALGLLFFALCILTQFSKSGEKLSILTIAGYASIIAFLIMWNLQRPKFRNWFLFVPFLCLATGLSILKYDFYEASIPTVNENLYPVDYSPLYEQSKIARLDKGSSFKITENPPRLDGATALYPVYAAFANAVYAEPFSGENGMHRLVQCGKTAGAYAALLEGDADIIFCAGPSEDQKRQFSERGLALRAVPIGKEAFVFFVNKINPVDNISIENIKGIYSGEIKNWKVLGGGRKRIRAFQRPKNSGSQTALEKIMNGTRIMENRDEDVIADMGGIIKEVAAYRNFDNAIGYSFLFFASEMAHNDMIKILAVNDVFPSRKTIQDGSYPFSENFYAIFVEADNQNGNIYPFIQWILGAEGQKLVEKTGYVTLAHNAQ